LTFHKISPFLALLERFGTSGGGGEGAEIFGVAEGNFASGLKFCGYFFCLENF
jgi:hypothetical protein